MALHFKYPFKTNIKLGSTKKVTKFLIKDRQLVFFRTTKFNKKIAFKKDIKLKCRCNKGFLQENVKNSISEMHNLVPHLKKREQAEIMVKLKRDSD